MSDRAKIRSFAPVWGAIVEKLTSRLYFLLLERNERQSLRNLSLGNDHRSRMRVKRSDINRAEKGCRLACMISTRYGQNAFLAEEHISIGNTVTEELA